MTIEPTITLFGDERERRFAWWPVYLDAGRLGGRRVWLRHYYAQPHSTGFWRWAFSIEPRPDRYVDGRAITIVGEPL